RIGVTFDIAYNCIREGNQYDPILSFKSIDNRSYYHLSEHDNQYYFDYTGTRNTVNCRLPNDLGIVFDIEY
ncbi:unnamed protein product, partial [Rotaria sp. Silwood1]